MTTIAPRSPALRVLRNLVLAWVGLSLLALAGAVVLSIHAMGWGCTGDSTMSGGLSWGACVLAWSMPVLGALASLFVSMVALFFVQLFYWAGAEAKDVRPRRWYAREALFDEVIDVAVDVVDD